METLPTHITGGQKDQYERLVRDVANKALAEANLDKDGFQRVIGNGNGDDLRDDLQTAIVAKLRELAGMNEYADEEVRSTLGYFSGYKPKGIAEQIEVLRKLFPNLGTYDESITAKPLPPGAEGWFAIPRHTLVAASYNDAVQRVLELLESDRKGKFDNCREGRIGSQYLRQTERAVLFWERLGDGQKGHDILIVPAQFGLRHGGRSVRRARAIMNSSEFGLGAFAVGVMLLTHPQRLKHYDDLWIDCAGDKYPLDADGSFTSVPFFHITINNGNVLFDSYCFSHALTLSGSASGFVPALT